VVPKVVVEVAALKEIVTRVGIRAGHEQFVEKPGKEIIFQNTRTFPWKFRTSSFFKDVTFRHLYRRRANIQKLAQKRVLVSTAEKK
jgi:hypothetical protein